MTTAPVLKVVPAAVRSVKRPSSRRVRLGDFLPQVKGRVERTDLLHQPIHELLRAAHGQRGDIVDRFVGIELRTLAAGVRERIHEMRADAQQAELEHLEQAAGAGSDDDDLRFDGRRGGGCGLAQGDGYTFGKGRGL